MSLYSELQRRNVIRVGLAYVVAAWLIIQVVETIFPAFRNLRDDPRWDDWLESIGMSAERLDAIEFNPDLPE